jgi:glucose-1-phosphate thymidylyltransferase
LPEEPYISRNEMTFGTFQGWWSDAGTFPSLARANELVALESVPFPGFHVKD